MKVTNYELIGSIDSCPKCGAMVQITPPPDEHSSISAGEEDLFGKLPQAPTRDRLSVGPSDDVDSAAITQSAISNEDAAAHSLPQPLESDEEYSTLAPPHESTSNRILNAASTRLDEVEDYRREVEVAWQSESTQRTKQLALISLLSCFGLITAGIVFSQFVRTWREQQTVAMAPETESVSPAIDETTTSVEGDTPGSIDQTAEASDSETPITEPPRNNPVDPPPTMESSAVATDDASVTTDPIPLLMTTPFEIGPSTEAMTSVRARDPEAATSKDKEEDAPPQMNSLPPGMLKFMPLLSLETTDNQAAPVIQPPPTIDTVRIDEAAAEANPDDISNPKRKPIDVEKALAQRFAIANGGASLAELTLILSQLTTVPIELELISFDAANKRVDAPIETPTGWVSARAWIDGLCASQGLVAQSFEGRLMISADDAAINAGIAPALLLDDFGDEAANVYEWISPLLQPDAEDEPAEENLLEDLEPAPAPETRLSEDGRSIIPAPSLKSKMRAVFAIESVRLMRGLPTKLERWRTSRWMGPWPEENNASSDKSFGEWNVVDGGIGGPRLDSPRTAAGLIRSIASLNQATALVGWLNATRLDFYPGDLMMPYSRQGTAGAMLDEILGEQGLQARVCGPSLWYLGTEASYDRFEVITWLPIPPENADVIRKRLANSLSIAEPTDMPIAFEAERMLVRCPRYLARQLARIIDP